VAEIVVREATPADAPDIAAIHEAAVFAERPAAHYSGAQIEAWAYPRCRERLAAQTAGRRFFIASDATGPLGYGQLDLAVGTVRSTYVHPGAPRRGCGRRLLEAMVAAAREAGLERLRLDASLNAVPFYEACGFSCGAPVVHRLANGFELPCQDMVLELCRGASDVPC
jgi:GNAT superfamily N-acetyltransferase